MLHAVTAQLGNVLRIGPSYRETRDCRALRRAIRQGDRPRVKELLARSPALAFRADDEGRIPLHWLAASGAGRSDGPGAVVMLAFLLDAHSDPNHLDKTGSTPLHVAVQTGCHAGWLAAMLARGADVHAVDARGRTALHLAMAAGASEACVVALLERGADALRPDRDGRCAMDYAADRRWNDARLTELASRRRASQCPAGTGPLAAPSRPLSRTMPVSCASPDALEQLLQRVGASVLGGMPPRGGDLVDILRQLASLLRQLPPQAQGAGFPAQMSLALEILIAVCPNVDTDALKAFHACVHAMRQTAADLETNQLGSMIALHMEMARLWMRTRQWKEAYGYAFSALRMVRGANANANVHANAEAVRQIERLIDRTERAMLREDLAEWGPAASVAVRAALFDVASRCMQRDAALPALREAGRLLAHAAKVRAWLRGDLDPALAVPVAEIRAAVSGLLNDTGSVAARAGEFVATAQLVLDLAAGMARLGLASEGAALCDIVARYRKDNECVGELRRYDCSAHKRLARELREPAPPSQQPTEPPKAIWRKLRAALQEIRTQAASACATLSLPSPSDPVLSDWRTPLPVEQMHETLTASFIAQLGRIAQLCEVRMLCEPPCRYAIMGLGSMSRGDMMPFSDVEFVLLLEREAQPGDWIERWFRRYTRLLELAFHGIGESATGADHPLGLPRGFELDPGIGCTAAWRDCVGTPEQVAGRLRQRAVANGRDGMHTDQDIHFSLLSAVRVHGDDALSTRWSRALSVELDEPDAEALRRYSARHDIALRQLHADATRLLPPGPRGERAGTGTVMLKSAYAAPLLHLLTGMAQCLGFRETQPRAVLARLDDGGYFSRDLLADWRWALATVQTIRGRMQLAAGERADSVASDKLGADERAALRAVRVRVARPLWLALRNWLNSHQFPHRSGSGAGVVAQLRALDGCEPAFQPFAGMQDAPRQRRADFGALHGLVATLAARSVDLTTMRHYYGMSISSIPSRLQPTCWAIWKAHLAGCGHGPAVLAALAAMPDRAGSRVDWNDARIAFLAGIRAWGEAPVCADTLLQLVPEVGDEAGGAAPFAVSQDIAAQLLRALDAPSGVEADGASPPFMRSVRVVAGDDKGAIEVHFHPANATADMACHALECRLTGAGGMPFGTLARIRIGGSWHAVYLVEEVAGPTLADSVAVGAATPERIEPGSFARALVRALLADPAGDDAGRYVLAPAVDGWVRLRRVGPEAAFPAGPHWPSQRVKSGHSVVFCLDQMWAPLDGDVMNALRRVEPDALVDAWLDDIRSMQQRYLAFFSDRDIVAAFDGSSAAALWMPVTVLEAESLLRSRLKTICGLAQLAATLDVALTGMDLLKAVRPDRAGHYLNAFARHPPRSGNGDTAMSDPAAPEQRLAFSAPDGDQKYGMAVAPVVARCVPRPVQRGDLAAAIDAIHAAAAAGRAGELMVGAVGVPIDGELDFENRDLPLPDSARQGPGDDHGAIVTGLMKGHAEARRAFAALSGVQRAVLAGFAVEAMRRGPWRPELNQQRLLLTALVDTPLAVLDLQPFAPVVDDALLDELLRGTGEHLRELDLSGCHRLGNGTFAAVERHAPGLERLAMRSMDLRALHSGEGPVVREWFQWSMPALRSLDVSGNPQLDRIRIDAPKLAALRARDCPRLSDIAASGTAIRELDLRGCPSLSEALLMRIAGAAAGRLDRVQLAGCVRLRHIEWRERFPWLLELPWNTWSEEAIGELDGMLSLPFDGAARVYSPPARDLVRQSLKMRQKVLDCLEAFLARPDVSATLRAKAAAALANSRRLHVDRQADEASATLFGSGEDDTAAAFSIFTKVLQTGTDERACSVALYSISRMSGLPSASQIERWMRL